MLVFDTAKQIWWLRLPRNGGTQDYSLPTWLAHKWVQLGMPNKEE